MKGLQCLKDCDAVVYDFLASEELLGVTRPDCRRIYVGKRAGHHSMKQPEINRLLVDLAKEGLCVARLKGGDPFVFGRGGEEALALEAEGIPYRLIPGVTSAVAVPECAGIPDVYKRQAYGKGWPVDQFKGKHVVVITGGTGLAPVKSMLNMFYDQPDYVKSVNLICGFKNEEGIIFKSDLERWKEKFNTIYTPVSYTHLDVYKRQMDMLAKAKQSADRDNRERWEREGRIAPTKKQDMEL